MTSESETLLPPPAFGHRDFDRSGNGGYLRFGRRHKIGVTTSIVSGDQKDAANKGFRIWYLLVPAGGEPPKSPGELRRPVFPPTKKDVIKLDYDDSGKPSS
jgi:hypothetical protein